MAGLDQMTGLAALQGLVLDNTKQVTPLYQRKPGEQPGAAPATTTTPRKSRVPRRRM